LTARPTIFIEAVVPLFSGPASFLPSVTMKRSAPKLYVATVNKSLGLGDGFAVVSAGEALETDEVAVVSDDISPVFCHEPSVRNRTLVVRTGL
jgi:hypothetical protein